MQLELHHWESLVATIEAGSVTKAAERLYVTQSALSHRLAEAERRLGHRLFERRPARPIAPTGAALALYQTARRVLPELERAEQDFRRSEGHERIVVRLGVGSYDCYHWFPGFLETARRQLPEMLFELVVVGDAPAARLSEGEVDVVLVVGQPEGRFASELLFEDELVLIAHPSHDVVDRDYVEPELLRDELYITYSRDPSPGFEFERFLRPADVIPKTTLVIEQTNAIAAMVAGGSGVSVLSRWAMLPWLRDGAVVAVPCGREGLSLSWHAAIRRDAPPDGPERQVTAVLATWLRTEAPLASGDQLADRSQ